MTHAAFDAFYAETSQRLWAYLLRLCNNRENAKDILQESYLRFLEKPPDHDDFAKMKSYLYTIATRLHFDRVRREKRKRLNVLERFSKKAATNVDPQVAANLQLDMSVIFDKLKPRERALLWLAYVEEQSHLSIAQILGMREKSVKVVLYRARRKLANLLEKFGINEKVGL